MKTIWKFNLKVDEGAQEIPMPTGAKVLTVALQDSKPTIWAEVDPTGKFVTRRFCIYATGQPIDCSPADREYIGTVQIVGLIAALVGHVFELT